MRRQRQLRSQQARGGVGFAGARAAGDDGQARAQRDGAGKLLPIASAIGQAVEQAVEPPAHLGFVLLRRLGILERQRGCACAQALRHLLFEVPVATQVQQSRIAGAGQNQR